MPHDKNGTPLVLGDKVNVAAVVTDIHMGEEFCNVTLETEEVMYPSGAKSTLALNAKQVEKASGAGQDNIVTDPRLVNPSPAPPDNPSPAFPSPVARAEGAAFEQIAGLASTAEGTYQAVHDFEVDPENNPKMTKEDADRDLRDLIAQMSAAASPYSSPDMLEIRQALLSMSSEPNREILRAIKRKADTHAEIPGAAAVGDTDKLRGDMNDGVVGQ